MGFDRNVVTTSPQETARLGEELGDYLVKSQESGVKSEGQGRAAVVCLYGELGSGKTTFAQGFARGLGITTHLPSPSFIIVRRYPIPSNLRFFYHIDLYRARGESDLMRLGLPEILTDSDSVVLIEWAEKLGELLPINRIDVRFSVLVDGKHHISICKKL